MQHLPITRMTLYKHGVGFFERRAQFNGETIGLSYRVEEMNDVLKSLTAIDWGEGQVLSIEYTTPQTREERLSDCTIALHDARSLRDLLIGLRGRQVRLHREHGDPYTGILVGIDEVPDRQPMESALVSIVIEDSSQVKVLALSTLRGVEILDDAATSDLSFFLETATGQETHRNVDIHLTPGDHDLAVSYIAPAPTWRVSYRLITDEVSAEGKGAALLQGWGIFDNRLGEDLQAVQLSLVAGMPISFVYDLYTPFTPERPVVQEEPRVAAGPVGFEGAVEALGMDQAREAPLSAPAMGAMRAMAVAPAAKARLSADALAQSAAVKTQGEALGELFQYTIETPVTVGRGQSAMVPIIASRMNFHKDLLYNGHKLPSHPVATLRLNNTTGLTLERGPVTVVESGEYVGEAVLPFTAPSSELIVPYAVELGIKVSEENGTQYEARSLKLKESYLHFEEWEIRWRDYRLSNSTGEPRIVLVEHPRTLSYDLFDTPTPQEKTDTYLRFVVSVPPHGEARLKVQERHLTRRREELHRQSYEGLQHYLQQGLIDQKTMDRVTKLLMLWQNIATYEGKLQECEKERQKIYEAQRQIQGNMGTLAQTGKEGTLRSRYVEQLEGTEEQLKALAQQEANLKAEIERVQREIAERLSAF